MMKFKKGAASFYIVAFSTLILLIIAASFAAVIISEVTRTSNDDLSQSAYDSALAGVEDAKLAFYNYRNCKANGGGGDCKTIFEIMENADCNMVGKILGRGEGEVNITESTVGNNMSQAYTCVKINTSLNDYRGTLSQSDQIKVVKVKFSDVEVDGTKTNITANDINSVKISWYSSDNAVASGFQYSNMSSDGKVVFNSLNGDQPAAAPPTISLALIQTGPTFNFDDFTYRRGEETNRGMIYLVPTNNTAWASKSVSDNYIGANGKISKAAFLKSNDKTASNLPYVVSCANSADTDFACSTTIELPKPIGGRRGDDTFYFVVGLPYGKPTADFSLEFFCGEGKTCSAETETITNENGDTVSETEISNQAKLEGVQIEVDSTGRANDLYRRVQARLENPDNFSLSVMGPLELLGDDDPEGDGLLNKTKAVICEWNFPNRGC